MWKLFIFSSLLSVALATQMEHFYGTWQLVANYAKHDNKHISCIQFTLEKNPNNTDCSCSNGLKLGEFKVIGEVKEENGTRRESNVLPLLIVDTPDQVNQGTNINCTCGETEYTSSMAIRSVNQKYFVMSEAHCIVTSETNCHLVSVMVFAKELPTMAELNETLNGIEELRGVNVTSKCASDK